MVSRRRNASTFIITTHTRNEFNWSDSSRRLTKTWWVVKIAYLLNFRITINNNNDTIFHLLFDGHSLTNKTDETVQFEAKLKLQVQSEIEEEEFLFQNAFVCVNALKELQDIRKGSIVGKERGHNIYENDKFPVNIFPSPFFFSSVRCSIHVKIRSVFSIWSFFFSTTLMCSQVWTNWFTIICCRKTHNLLLAKQCFIYNRILAWIHGRRKKTPTFAFCR